MDLLRPLPPRLPQPRSLGDTLKVAGRLLDTQSSPPLFRGGTGGMVRGGGGVGGLMLRGVA